MRARRGKPPTAVRSSGKSWSNIRRLILQRSDGFFWERRVTKAAESSAPSPISSVSTRKAAKRRQLREIPTARRVEATIPQPTSSTAPAQRRGPQRNDDDV